MFRHRYCKSLIFFAHPGVACHARQRAAGSAEASTEHTRVRGNLRQLFKSPAARVVSHFDIFKVDRGHFARHIMNCPCKRKYDIAGATRCG